MPAATLPPSVRLFPHSPADATTPPARHELRSRQSQAPRPRPHHPYPLRLQPQPLALAVLAACLTLAGHAHAAPTLLAQASAVSQETMVNGQSHGTTPAADNTAGASSAPAAFPHDPQRAAETSGTSAASQMHTPGTAHLRLAPHAHIGTTTLPAVTVQARRAEERARDLPFTVNVASDVELEQQRVINMEDVLRNTPGVEVNSWGSTDNANVRIRGVGSLYQSGTDDTSVVVNVDGTPTSAANVSVGTLDVEQIEILKGPQGTLFGRSSAAGAVNIRSARPVLGRFEGHLQGEVGNEHRHQAEGVVNVPLGSALAARVALRHNARDLWYVNSATGKPLSRPSDLAGRASLLWQPQAQTQVLLRASRHDAKKYQAAMLARPYSDPPAQALNPDSSIDGNRRTINQYALEIQHDLPWARLTSVTSRERIDHKEVNITGRRISGSYMGEETVFDQNRSYHSRGWNEDLRLSSPKNSDVFWVGGLNIYRNDWNNTNAYLGSHFAHDLTEKSDALYGEATWPIAGTPLKITTGLRHTRTRKTYSAVYNHAMAGLSTSADSLRQNHTTGRVGVGWALDAQTNLYATLSRGRKASGYNDNATSEVDSTPYAAGTVDSLELGAKRESADGRLRLDVALFTNRVKNDHLQSFDLATTASRLLNVDTRSRGLEISSTWRAGHGFTLQGGLTLIDGSVRNDVATNMPSGNVRAGNRLPDIPRLSALLGVQWERSLPSFAGLNAPTLDVALNMRHVGKRAADPQNSFDLGAYQKIDLHVGLTSGNTEVYLWGDNLLDKRYDLYGYYLSSTSTAGMPSYGRSMGVGVTHHI